MGGNLVDEIVYYGVTNSPNRPHGLIHSKEPTPAIKEFVGDANELRFLKCPAYKDVMHNVFAMPSWFSLELSVNENNLSSKNAPQDFLDNYLTTHSNKYKVYAIEQSTMFIAQNDSLVMTQEPARMTDNLFTQSCNVISGTFDIGKHFRMLSCAFYIKKNLITKRKFYTSIFKNSLYNINILYNLLIVIRNLLWRLKSKFSVG